MGADGEWWLTRRLRRESQRTVGVHAAKNKNARWLMTQVSGVADTWRSGIARKLAKMDDSNGKSSPTSLCQVLQ